MDPLAEVNSLPDRHANVQYAHTRDRAADPAGGNKTLQFIKPSLARCQHQKVIVAPVAETEQALRNPWQASQ